MYQTGRSERCIYNVPISGALDSRLQVKQVSRHTEDPIRTQRKLVDIEKILHRGT